MRVDFDEVRLGPNFAHSVRCDLKNKETEMKRNDVEKDDPLVPLRTKRGSTDAILVQES